MAIAAIYSPYTKDMYFHASMSCEWAEIVHAMSPNKLGKSADDYRVGSLQIVRKASKHPCLKCWVPDGYKAVNDPIAAKGL